MNAQQALQLALYESQKRRTAEDEKNLKSDRDQVERLIRAAIVRNSDLVIAITISSEITDYRLDRWGRLIESLKADGFDVVTSYVPANGLKKPDVYEARISWDVSLCEEPGDSDSGEKEPSPVNHDEVSTAQPKPILFNPAPYYIADSDREKVLSFIASHPFLIPLLDEAPDRIKEYFGDTLRSVDLRMTEDRIEPNTLYISIKPWIPSGAALDTLRRLGRGWWLNVIGQAQHKLGIIVEYE